MTKKRTGIVGVKVWCEQGKNSEKGREKQMLRKHNEKLESV